MGGTRVVVFELFIRGPEGWITGDGFGGTLKLKTLFTVAIECKLACGECRCNDGLERGIGGGGGG